jgi:hypothetical protein
MASATHRRSASSNGSAASGAVEKAKEAGSSAVGAARSVRGPALTAGAAAAGLVSGLALGSQLNGSRRGLLRPRPRVLGVPLGRKSGLQRTVETLGKAAKELGSATQQVSSTTADIRQVREELEKSNRQSPVEVLLNGLTQRRGTHKR